MKLETTSIHAGQTIDPTTGALIAPIYLSTTFERQEDGTYPLGYSYTRGHNPNRSALEAMVATLEGGTTAAAFASGSAATMTILQALAPHDHVLAPADFYYGIRQLLTEVFVPWGLEVSFVDMTDLAAVQAAIQPNTRLLMLETPSNPMLNLTDLAAVAEMAHAAGAYVMCDNTVATPFCQRPISQGIDFVVHATTKYLAGHSDVLGGIVVTKTDNPLWQRIKFLQKMAGAVPSPFECWLALRGLQTLPYRMQGHVSNALKIAHFLVEHTAVERVLYPGLETHPGYEIACKQMNGFGGIVSFQVKGGQAEAMAVAAKAKLFTRATSFGGVHSLIEHRASIEPDTTTVPVNLLRLSVGLETADDLIADLAQALE
jgi:cystathionine gamma-synthase